MTKFIEWNDVDALEEALKDEDVIAVIAEPVMTNMGIIHPDPGYHEALRALTRKYGTYLLIDETHTICTGIGGYTRAYGLEPDILTAGKTLASGIPVGIWGVSEEFGKLCQPVFDSVYGFAKGVGGTLAANALTMATLRATLSEILTEDYYERNIALATRFNEASRARSGSSICPGTRSSWGCGRSTGSRRSRHATARTPITTRTWSWTGTCIWPA